MSKQSKVANLSKMCLLHYTHWGILREA